LFIGSTKSLSGHALGAAGVNESIYSLLMLQNDFMAESVNINTLDEAAAGMPIVQTTTKQTLNRVMSNSFGFGGTNACYVKISL
jgi:3-oxoacyl-[acyl-carrier-protein] synthase-1